MTSCNICLEGFKQPVSLPCGHIFCTQCIVKTVQAVRPLRNLHPCPMCRAPYNIAPLDPLALPPHIRPFVTPTIRRVYINSPEDSQESSSSIPPNVAGELALLRTENQALRSHCTLWRRRAELHGAATLGLLDFARTVRDQATMIARERDEWARQCHTLKRKLDNYGQPSQPKLSSWQEPLSTSFDFTFPLRGPSLDNTSPRQSSPSTSCPPSTIEASRLAVAALFDFPSCINPPTLSTHLQSTVDLEPWSSQSQSAAVAPNPPVSAPSSSFIASSSSSLPVITPSQTHLGPPPAKRTRRDVGDRYVSDLRDPSRVPLPGSSSRSRISS